MKRQEIIRALDALAFLEETQQVKKVEEISLENFELPVVKPFIDEKDRKEKKDRRQQHKYAVKYSNRKK